MIARTAKMMQRIASLSNALCLIAMFLASGSVIQSISANVDSLPVTLPDFVEHVKVGEDAQQFHGNMLATDDEMRYLHVWAKEGNDEEIEKFLSNSIFKRPALAHQYVNAQRKNGFTPLHYAVVHATPEEMMDEQRSRHRVRTIQLLLQNYANPRLRERRYNHSAFHMATLLSTPAIVKLLLDHDNACRRRIRSERISTPIHREILVSKFYNMRLSEYKDEIASIPLINSRDKDGNTALILLAQVICSKSVARSVEMASFLLAQPTPADSTLLNSNGESVIDIAAWNGNVEMLKLLLGSFNQIRKMEILDSLLQTVPLDDNHDSTLLHLWAQNGDDKMLEVFLSDPIPPTAHPYSFINDQGNNGFSPLHYAVLDATPEEMMDEQRSQSRVRTIQLLLQNFANPRLPFAGECGHTYSAFHMATLSSTPAIVKLLLDHDGGCRKVSAERFHTPHFCDYDDDIDSIPLINSRDQDGNTALILLAKVKVCGSKSVARILDMTSFLLAQPTPADSTLLNNKGESAIAIAALNGNVKMLKLLLDSIKQLSEKKTRISLLQTARQLAESCGQLESASLLSKQEQIIYANEKLTEQVHSPSPLSTEASSSSNTFTFSSTELSTISGSSLCSPAKRKFKWSSNTSQLFDKINYLLYPCHTIKLSKDDQD